MVLKLAKTFIMRLLSLLLFICLTLFACQSDPASKYSELDLMSYGVPLKIMAPDSADIKKEDMVVQKGVSIKKGEDYDVQIWASEASSLEVATVKANKLADTKSRPIFSQIIKEDDHGFIFENKIDSNTLYYGFYHIVIQGDNEYIFQNGLRGNFTKEQAEAMYEAVSTH